ncbi:MAG: hypothetical protein HC906_04940, partial [Bacteroidales bacterium]|nr:hypothetical protein [Bacteroidales bacterium]
MFNVGGETILRSKDGFFQIPYEEKLGNFFKAWIEENKLFLEIIIRDQDGNIIATVEGQTWKIYNSGYDYNNDESGFEIVTPDKNVV